MIKVQALLKKLDDHIIHVLQEGYLWLFDRTGIYVASVSLILFAAANCFFVLPHMYEWNVPIKLLMGVLALCNFLFLGIRYYLQGTSVTAFNLHAASMKETPFRHFFNIQLAMFMVLELAMMDMVFMESIMFIAYNYTFCIMIRDRQKKPWFERETMPEAA